MYILNFLLFFYCLIKSFKSSDDFNIETNIQILNLSNHLDAILKNITQPNNTKISAECISNINSTYKGKQLKLLKLYEDSSKDFVDLSSFYSCINDENNTFFTIYPNLTNDAKMEITRLNENNLDEHLWIFGVCLLKNNCDSDDIKYIFDAVNNLFYKTFKFYTSENISVVDFYKAKEEYLNNGYFVKYLSPFIVVIIQIIFMIFKIIPVKIFSCIFRRKYLKESNKDENQKNTQNNLDYIFSLSKQIALKIRKCFSISEIIDDLTYSNKSELFKDEDMTYLKGIKTLGIICLIYGFNFMILYNYPLCTSSRDEREKFLESRRMIYLTIFMRLGPALILSSSGYSLSYKFLCFLDKKLANIIPDRYSSLNDDESNKDNENKDKDGQEQDNIDKIASKMKEEKSMESSNNSSTNEEYYENTFGIRFYNQDIAKSTLNKIFKGQKINENSVLSQVSTNKMPNYIYFNFIFRQFHRLLFLLLGLAMFKYAFPILLLRAGNSPMMYYLYQTYFLQLSRYIFNFMFFGNFLDLFQKTDEFLITKLFCIPISEFNYFIICTILIFICYKKKLRLDIICAFLIIAFIIFKIVIIAIDFDKMNPGMLYTDTAYQGFFFNPIFNFDFFLIGMLFGIMNYIIQNGIEKKKALIKERPFVKMPLYFLKFTDYKKNKNIVRFIIILLLMLFALLAIPIFFMMDFKNIIENNSPNIFFKIISLFDIELFIFTLHFLLISSYVSGRNLFFKLFDIHFSSYIMKLSYWLIFSIPTITYLVVYSNEANLKLNFFLVLMYSTITFINGTVISFILFLFLELPYKKLIKLYFNINSEINKVYLENDDENNSLDNGIGLDELNEKDIIDEKNDIYNQINDNDEDDAKD